MQAWLERARELDADVVVSAVTVAELIRGLVRVRDAAVNRVLKAALVSVVSEVLARRAGRLLADAGSAATIDALVAATALTARGGASEGRRCAVLTSDPGDFAALLDGQPRILIVSV